MISVCIATFNGEFFIERQLNSILPQLAEHDEIVVVDDCSTDQTVNVIRKLADKRIRVTVNKKNIGPMNSFEKALSLSKGDVIFLCDQDDIWLSNKVKVMMDSFTETDADLMIHDAEVVDGNLARLDSSWNHYNRNDLNQKLLGNIMKNAYTGCMMAFKQEMKELILPIPETVEMHDQWVAIVALITHKKIWSIDIPLMQYVRHGGNVTAIKKRGILTQLMGRIGTIKAIFQYKKDNNR